MFKRRQKYVMGMDADVDYAPIEPLIRDHDLDPDEAKAHALNSLIGHLEQTAQEAIRQTGQKWDCAEVEPSGEWPRIQVRFQGTSEGARAAFELWAEKAGTLAGVKRVLAASLHGDDGTNLQYMDKEHQQQLHKTWSALPESSQDLIDQLMDQETPTHNSLVRQTLRAMVGLRLGDGVEAVTVEFEGDEALIPHLPAATWDKLLATLSRSKHEQHSLLQRWEGMVMMASASLRDEGKLMLSGVPLAEHVTRPADVTMSIEFVGAYENERLGVNTKFKPFHSASAALAEQALWSVWDWTTRRMEYFDAYEAMIADLVHQCEYYRRFGPPGIRDIGKAPYYGARKGANERLQASLRD